MCLGIFLKNKFRAPTGIELVSETTEEELNRAEGPAPDLVAGVQLAYTKPTEQVCSMFYLVNA